MYERYIKDHFQNTHSKRSHRAPLSAQFSPPHSSPAGRNARIGLWKGAGVHGARPALSSSYLKTSEAGRREADFIKASRKPPPVSETLHYCGFCVHRSIRQALEAYFQENCLCILIYERREICVQQCVFRNECNCIYKSWDKSMHDVSFWTFEIKSINEAVYERCNDMEEIIGKWKLRSP